LPSALRKLLIFTEHRDTLNHLCEHLKKWGYTTCEIHGGMNPHERKRAQEDFRTSRQVCVATEAAGEGINLQFCRLMVNCDLPWNPTRLRDFAKRGDDEDLGMPTDDGQAAPLVDALHRTLWLMEKRPTQLAEFLMESQVNREQLRLVAQALAGPALKGGELGDVSPTAELSALAKLTANWQIVVEGALISPVEQADRRKGQERLLWPQKSWPQENAKSTKMKTEINELCDRVRQTAYDIHVFHGHGHLEKVYENALAHRLRKLGLEVKQQHALKVYDEDGTLIGEYAADLLVDNRLIVELKAAKTLADEHVAQLLGYLKSSRIEDGLLINFGSYKFEIRKFVLGQDRSARSSGRLSGLVFGLFALSAFFCGESS
jgi:GxxExxY protein